MSAQAPAHKQAGGKAGVLAGPRAVGWARWLGDGAWAPASAPPLTARPCDLGQAPCPVWPTVSTCIMKLLNNIVSTQDVVSEPKGQPVSGTSPEVSGLSLPFDDRLRVQADTRSPWELLEVEPQVMQRS